MPFFVLLSSRVEMGPRMSLKLMKIEEGLCEGKTLHHAYSKSHGCHKPLADSVTLLPAASTHPSCEIFVFSLSFTPVHRSTAEDKDQERERHKKEMLRIRRRQEQVRKNLLDGDQREGKGDQRAVFFGACGGADCLEFGRSQGGRVWVCGRWTLSPNKWRALLAILPLPLLLCLVRLASLTKTSESLVSTRPYCILTLAGEERAAQSLGKGGAQRKIAAGHAGQSRENNRRR